MGAMVKTRIFINHKGGVAMTIGTNTKGKDRGETPE